MEKKNEVSRGKVLSSLFWAYCENISAQLVSFVVSVILARILAPSDYGSIALVTVFINLAAVFVTSGFTTSLIQKKDADQLDYDTMFWFNSLVAIFLFLILFFAAPSISRYYNQPILLPVLRVLALRVPLSAVNSIQMAFVSNRMIFKKSFLSTLIGAAISGVIGIIMAYKGFGLWALVAQSLSNVIFNTLLLTIIVSWKPKLQFSYNRFKSLFQFGWKMLLTSLMFTGYTDLRTLVIGKKYSTENLGYYNKGNSIPQIIGANIDSTITRVMFATLSQTQDNISALGKMTRRAAKTSAYLMTPILFGLAVVAETFVSVLLTDKWLPCVPYLQIMCMVWWLQPTQSCSIQAIKAIGRSDLYLKIEIANKILGISMLVAAVFFFDTPLAIAISMLCGQIVAFFTYGINIHRRIGYTIKQQLSDVLIPGVIGGIMCIAVYFVGRLISNNILSLVIQVITGGIVYISISEIFKPEQYMYLRDMIFSALRRKKQ